MPRRNHHRRRLREDDGEEELQYGLRRSRRETSWEYRDSSSLTPVQVMEQEIYYHTAQSMVHRGVLLGHVLALLAMMYHYYEATLLRLENSGMADLMARSILRVRQLRQRCKDSMDKLYLAIIWITAYGELAWLYAEDLSIYVRRRHRFQPERQRTMNDISARDCHIFFGINPDQLRLLFLHWRIPDQFTSPHRHVFSGEECFIIFLYHLLRGSPFTEMARQEFGGDPRHFTYMWNAMNDHLYETFYHKISGTSLNQWLPHEATNFRRLIYDTLQDGAIEETRHDNNGDVVEIIRLDFEFDTFRIFGFLDDTSIPTARPGDEARRRGDFEVDVQRSYYSGYFSSHGLKCQLVYLPNGLIGSVFIAEMRQNDNGVQNMSGLNNYLLQLLQGTGLGNFVGGLLPALYCDGIFTLLPTIIPRYVGNPTPLESLLNIRLASVRQCIEHVFADHHTFFRLFWVPHYLRMMNQGSRIRRMSLNSFFIQNCIYCLNGTRCRFFGQLPPDLEDYLPLDKEMPPPPAVDLGDVWDFDI